MLNKITAMIRQYAMIVPGQTVTVAVSGGADSVALLYALFLLREKLEIRLEAAHFNHSLRGEESDRDEAFVRDFCDRYDIPCHVGKGTVVPGEKGLEAAAREVRYGWFARFDGPVATAHTADDNAETVLMHLVRGTGLKGLGGIAPVRGSFIRPMLGVTRQEVLEFLQEHCLGHVEDSTNAGDAFLRNRLRHHVMPLLKQENPRLAENLSAMALKLRQDEDLISSLAGVTEPKVEQLRQFHPALRSRVIASFLEQNGVREPEAAHLALVEKLVFSEKPSAKAQLPGGITVTREYGLLRIAVPETELAPQILTPSGCLELPGLGLWMQWEPAEREENRPDCFTVTPVGPVTLRHRLPGDEIRLSGGKKSVKKLFIDRKVPAARRLEIPVLADEQGILGIYGLGADLDRFGPGLRIRFIKKEKQQGEDQL